MFLGSITNAGFKGKRDVLGDALERYRREIVFLVSATSQALDTHMSICDIWYKLGAAALPYRLAFT